MTEKQILVADDSPLIRDLVQVLLSARGHRVDEAKDGLEAVKRMKETTYDLVLSDIQMPHLDGMRVLEEARRLQPKTRVILMSGQSFDPVEVLERGAFDWMEKPFSLEAFQEKIERSLGTLEPEKHESVVAG